MSPSREILTCPVRMSQPGPWEAVTNLDVWEIGYKRWTVNDGWHDDWGLPPRYCSFCGSVRPDDLIRLVAADWEWEPTVKKHKHYFHPPGYHDMLIELQQNISLSGDYISISPPIKLYGWHLTQELADSLNQAIKAWRKRRQC